ncbi:glutamine-dependent NAD synthetase [Cordyceps fumosorosea ARSEF 2679]|uniref:Glutamine-dependent NAD(+) synthetase n=1 Tax=Cordyceps fumosorosea (strain ARSEF 2679) TaxID=1081104 RepID=A0A167V263_CORFA|nr:glutamine-dependent NAD synthetase [Cordyceps fumosorosea ARSEF 2679]OAA62146.1 glutamine-dependent NAD synthetase [Cordyceps fumosorosea ARSEF 2679]
MGRLVTVAASSLRQWALDFEGNTDRIIQSIHQAKAAGARLRVGPELEISGYSCNDHFLEPDLYLHSMEMLARILEDETCHGILLDIGLPVTHRSVNYNCRVICLDGKILFIRPKMHLANDGNYREMRYFTPWVQPTYWEEFHLPKALQKLQGSTHVPFGDCVISTPDSCFGAETCEEMWTPNAPHIPMTLDGVEIITNSSASHFSLQKLDTRLKLIGEATRKCGGVYIYSNASGGDGDRLYFDGSAMILCNGQVLAQSPQFSLNDVDVVTATVDLEEVRAYRSSISRALQAAHNTLKYKRIQTLFELSPDEDDLYPQRRPTPPREPKFFSADEEIALCTGCYLWDYLTRSKSGGYLVPLSGGLDSCATAISVFSMCRLVMSALKDENKPVIATVQRIFGQDELPRTAQELCRRVLHTVYMGMSKQSSRETRTRAKELSEAIGSYHIDLDIDTVYHAQKSLVEQSLGFDAKFKVEGGSEAENLMLQNIQARTRMVTAYEFAQILPTTRKLTGGGLLVLGSANVGEALRGYMTKYDCSSADINPIGSIDKAALRGLISWAQVNFGIPCLEDFLTAAPTAELEPVTEDYVQSDEADMGITYAELTIFGMTPFMLTACDDLLTEPGRLRKERKMGPLSMWQHLVHVWGKDRVKEPNDENPCLDPAEIAEKVKFFFVKYAITRHKATTLTPASNLVFFLDLVHCNDYSPDDNRFDLRPFLYPSFWQSWSFKRIDKELARIEKARQKQ